MTLLTTRAHFTLVHSRPHLWWSGHASVQHFHDPNHDWTHFNSVLSWLHSGLGHTSHQFTHNPGTLHLKSLGLNVVNDKWVNGYSNYLWETRYFTTANTLTSIWHPRYFLMYWFPHINPFQGAWKVGPFTPRGPFCPFSKLFKTSLASWHQPLQTYYRGLMFVPLGVKRWLILKDSKSN